MAKIRKWSAGIAIALGCAAQQAPSAIIGDPAGSGPWPAVSESRAELPMHTVYRPQRLPDTPLPLYVWGNGGCSANGLAHAAYLREIASQGYIVVALGTANAAPAAGRAGVPPAAGAPPASAAAPPAGDPTTAAQMIEAIDWATRENAKAGGEFRNHINLERIAVGGHSCGGLQAIAVSHDPRIDTTLVLNSGVYIRPGGRSQVAVDKTQLAKLHGPMLYLTGGPGDVAHENALDDFAKIDSVPVFIGSLGVGHGGTFSQPNGGEWAQVTVRWLNWNLKGDAEAARDFSGASCRLCSDARWTIQQKRLPAPAGAPRQ